MGYEGHKEFVLMLEETDKLLLEGHYEQVVDKCGKILAHFLTLLYRDLWELPTPEKRRLLEIEEKVGNGKPVKNFQIGQLIGLFADPRLVDAIAKARGIGTMYLDPKILNKINKLRVDAEHLGYKPTDADATFMRSAMVKMLAEYRIIQEVKDRVDLVSDQTKLDLSTKKKNRILSKIRLALASDPTVVVDDSIVDDLDNAAYFVSFEGEIVGVYEEDGRFAVLVYEKGLAVSDERREESFEVIAKAIKKHLVIRVPEARNLEFNINFFDSYEDFRDGAYSSCPV